MADDFPEGLPLGWILDRKVRRDGTVERFYHNIATGQKFKTKEELVRYANYCKRVASSYYDDFKECYRNSKGVYVERPWEIDPYNTLSDYVEGRVGKVKDKLAGNSSSISTSSSVITSDGKMPEMLPKKSEAKAKKNNRRHRRRKKVFPVFMLFLLFL